MKRSRRIACGFTVPVLWLLVAGVAPRAANRELESPHQAEAEKPALEAGQEWTYDNRPGEEDSTILIGNVVDHPEHGRVMLVDIKEIRFGGHRASANVIAFSEAALSKSVRELVATGQESEIQKKLWKQWKKGIRKGTIPVNTVTVREFLKTIPEP